MNTVQPIFCPYGTQGKMSGNFISTNIVSLTGHIILVGIVVKNDRVISARLMAVHEITKNTRK